MTEYKYECAKVRIHDGIAWLTMNRPDKRNAMSPQLHYDMDDALARLEVDDNVKVVDAAIAERTKHRGRVKVHQTEDMGAMKGGFHVAAIGVVVGALVAGPAGAVAVGAAGGLLHSLRSKFHDIGIDDKWMREVSKEIDKGKSALFVQYEGSWAASIGLIENAIKAENALLIQSTLPGETAAALRALVEPAAEALGGEEVVADYEVQIEEETPEEAAQEVFLRVYKYLHRFDRTKPVTAWANSFTR